MKLMQWAGGDETGNGEAIRWTAAAAAIACDLGMKTDSGSAARLKHPNQRSGLFAIRARLLPLLVDRVVEDRRLPQRGLRRPRLRRNLVGRGDFNIARANLGQVGPAKWYAQRH
jgi:hypothetical protein